MPRARKIPRKPSEVIGGAIEGKKISISKEMVRAIRNVKAVFPDAVVTEAKPVGH